MEVRQPSLPPAHRQEACRLCGHNAFALMSQVDRRGQSLDTVACRNCGLISHREIPSDQQLADYYARQYREDYHGEFTPSAHRVVREWRRGGALVDLLRGHLQAGDRVLEVGAGIGCTVKQFELAGFEASGIEPGDGFRGFSQEKLQAAVRPGVWQQLMPDQAHDLVLLVHVMEHFNDPVKALRRIRQSIRPNGLLYIEVPNFGAPHAAPGRQFHYAHIYNFTATTLKAACRTAGFTIVQRLGDDGDKDLRLLARARGAGRLDVDPDGYRQSVDALQRYNKWTYHLRWNYLASRCRTVWAHRRGSLGRSPRNWPPSYSNARPRLLAIAAALVTGASRETTCMISQLTRYVIRDLLQVFLTTLIGLSLLLIVVVLAHQAVREGLGPVAIVRMVPYVVPNALRIAIPGTVLFATCSVYGRMSAANEIVAVKSLGISPMAVIRPALVLSFVLSLVAVWLNDVAVSWGRLGINRVILQSAEQIMYGVLRTQGSYSNGRFSISVSHVDEQWLMHPTIDFHGDGANRGMTLTAPPGPPPLQRGREHVEPVVGR